jgi:hypothetical protein
MVAIEEAADAPALALLAVRITMAVAGTGAWPDLNRVNVDVRPILDDDIIDVVRRFAGLARRRGGGRIFGIFNCCAVLTLELNRAGRPWVRYFMRPATSILR